MNFDAEKMAEQFWKLLNDGNVEALNKGFFTDSMVVWHDSELRKGYLSHSPPDKIAHKGKQATQTPSRPARMEQCNLEQYRLGRTEVRVPVSRTLKSVKISKSMHGWLNTGNATESHKFPRCLKTNTTQECRHVGAHKKRYDLVIPMIKQILKKTLPSPRSLRKHLYRT